MTIKVLPAALDDIREGRRFYEARQEGLGDEFQEALFSDIDSLVRQPGVHRAAFGFHRALSRRFPFAIYYRLEGSETILVWRVLDLRQSPDSIKKKLV